MHTNYHFICSINIVLAIQMDLYGLTLYLQLSHNLMSVQFCNLQYNHKC